MIIEAAQIVFEDDLLRAVGLEHAALGDPAHHLGQQPDLAAAPLVATGIGQDALKGKRSENGVGYPPGSRFRTRSRSDRIGLSAKRSFQSLGVSWATSLAG